METLNAENDRQEPSQAVAYITGAHEILKALHEEIGRHPEIGAAITKLEMALNLLAVKTGGLL